MGDRRRSGGALWVTEGVWVGYSGEGKGWRKVFGVTKGVRERIWERNREWR